MLNKKWSRQFISVAPLALAVLAFSPSLALAEHVKPAAGQQASASASKLRVETEDESHHNGQPEHGHHGHHNGHDHDNDDHPKSP